MGKMPFWPQWNFWLQYSECPLEEVGSKAEPSPCIQFYDTFMITVKTASFSAHIRPPACAPVSNFACILVLNCPFAW